MKRRHHLALALLCAIASGALGAIVLAEPARAARGESFAGFLAGLWMDAKALGVSRTTFDAAFAHLSPDPAIIPLTQQQSEFAKPIWSYLDGAVSPARLARGQAAARQYANALARAERKYGVEPAAILGIWGMETNFGAFTGNKDVIRSLATLAYLRYRDDFFRDELLAALQILEAGHIDRAGLKGSWAGAMGQTQFMPSSYLKHAVDGDGDGVKDIWTSAADAIASTASYLSQHGWQAGLPWGMEVKLPPRFDLAAAQGWMDFSSWRRAGLSRSDGEDLPASGKAMLYLPAGVKGPALLVSENYRVIKKYNSSDAYALGVAHLGERILGGAALSSRWPRNEKRLSGPELMEVQRRLRAMGLPVGNKIDGRIGEISRESVRKAQIRFGFPADGYPTPELLARLRQRP